jgi:3'-5' exoribonuclease
MEIKKISEVNINEEFIAFLLVSKVEIKTKKNGEPYLSLELKDKALTFQAVMWENFENVKDELEPGRIIKIQGTLSEYNGGQQIKISRLRVADEKDGIKLEDFLPVSKRPLDEMLDEFERVTNSINNEYLKKLIDSIFDGQLKERFIMTPAGKSWHHAYIHGLLEHTLEIVKICDLVATFHPEINRDLLIAGALLHDIGKTEELDYKKAFGYTDKGSLLGHITIAAIEVEKAIDKIEGFPEELKNQTLHLILSHQGKLEFASPVVPKTLEAIVLYHADELSAKANAYKNAIIAESEGDKKWTKYIYLAETNLYIPEDLQKRESNEGEISEEENHP